MIRTRSTLLLLPLLCGVAAAATNSHLENPSSASNQSGIGIISGWHCDASKIEIVFDDRRPLLAAYGTHRADTETICGDINNGFGLTWSFNLLGEGSHRVRAYADDVLFADTNFTVNMLEDGSFIRDVSGSFELEDFPQDATITTVEWTESLQNFTIKKYVELDPDRRKWVASAAEDPIASVSLAADDSSTYYGAMTPELVVECAASNMGISVEWNDQVNSTNAFTSVSAADAMFMFPASDTISSTVPTHMTSNIINTMLQNDQMSGSTLNAAGDKIIAEFDIRGFDQAYLEVQAACM